jgi:hypothetical protein
MLVHNHQIPNEIEIEQDDTDPLELYVDRLSTIKSFKRLYGKRLQDDLLNYDAHNKVGSVVSSLKKNKRKIFNTLMVLYYDLEDSGSTDQLYPENYNVISWINIFARAANKLSNNVESVLDCWDSSYLGKKGNNYNYPNMNVSNLVKVFKKGQGTRLFATKSKMVRLHRQTASLIHPNVKDLTKQVAHRCIMRSKQYCFNPLHTIICSDSENKNMQQCVNGCAHYCPHKPVCIWTNRETGKYLLCRNRVDKPIAKHNCKHVPNCFN